MELLNKGSIAIALAAILSLLPISVLLVVAVVVIIAHMYSLSLVVMGCVAIIFLMMFIVYFRFSAELSWVALLTPFAMGLQIPYVLPVVCGLLVGPLAAVPMACGVVAYYMFQVVDTLAMSDTIGTLSMEGMMEDAFAFADAILECKDIVLYIVVLSVGTCVVWGVKKIHIAHAWKIAVGAGCLAMFFAMIITSPIVDVDFPAGMFFLGIILAALIGIAVEFLYLSVDYRKTEFLEFEDDDYYYCVKAIPKVAGEMSKSATRTRNRNQEQEGNLVDGYSAGDYENAEYEEAEYGEASYADAGYDDTQYTTDGYETPIYEGKGYADDGYGAPVYVGEKYGNEEYVETEGRNQAYEYDESGYEEQGYEAKSYEQQGFVDSNYNGYEWEDTSGVGGSTTVFETDDVERELRSNAYNRASTSEESKKNHLKTNYRMLQESMKDEMKRRK